VWVRTHTRSPGYALSTELRTWSKGRPSDLMGKRSWALLLTAAGQYRGRTGPSND
jgi:hypothetical protein